MVKYTSSINIPHSTTTKMMKININNIRIMPQPQSILLQRSQFIFLLSFYLDPNHLIIRWRIQKPFLPSISYHPMSTTLIPHSIRIWTDRDSMPLSYRELFFILGANDYEEEVFYLMGELYLEIHCTKCFLY